MKKIIGLLLAGLQIFSVAAQEISSRELDSLSQLISKWQKQTDGIVYKIGNDEGQELRFPVENFRIWSYNTMATHAIHKSTGEADLLELTENIDLSKAVSIVTYNYSNGNKVIFTHRITFPPNTLRTQVYEDGKLVRTDKRDYLDIIQAKEAVNGKAIESAFKEYLTIGYAINLIKKARKQIAYDPEEITKLCLNLAEKNSEKDYRDFLKKYPQTIYTDAVNVQIDRFRKLREKRIADIRYLDNFLAKFKVKQELTLNNIFQEIPEASFLQNFKKDDCLYIRKFRKKEMPVVGPHRIMKRCMHPNSADLSSYTYIMFVSESQEEVLKERNKLVAEFKKNIDNKYIEDIRENSTTIYSPKGRDGIRFNISHSQYDNHQKWFYYEISFFDFIEY